MQKMSNIKAVCSILILKILRCLIRILYFIPIKPNRILFTSYIGEEYSCNPKYISEYMQKIYPCEYEIVWAFKNVAQFSNIKGIKRIHYKSLKWLYYEITAKVIVGNNGAVWIPRRKEQLIIDTWHGGGCYKKVAADNQNLSLLGKYRTKISGQEVSLYLSSSEYFSDNVIKKSFMFDGEILPSGMPRNDIMFADGDFLPEEHLREKIAEKYTFDPNAYIILFAPTWRKDTQRTEQLDIEQLKKTVRERFGKCAVILGRGHHTESKILEQNVIDVTEYSDMQELLLITDMLITDYSSCMWDFSFTGKPCLLFTPDLDIYQENPGFDCEIDTWGFMVSKSNQELMSAIQNFDVTEFKIKMKNHHDALKNYEDGHACSMVCKYIKMFCEGEI